ncbi:hypothetical protein T265_08472 [Opisthorchis viverrini]|uniref:Uncharacterized protein n=1 Tax=Opisthorchis viverrini TaxID=6198 RepID=A0A074ZDL5_OPIVI|nr:hypothetical protein T265_08472 [Opisthorchis viverrini]KER23707.1 hypothetical protein T265_08472 [Opisthorchis viverrini]
MQPTNKTPEDKTTIKTKNEDRIKTEQIPQSPTQTLHTISMRCKLVALITVVLSTTLTANGSGISCYQSIGCAVEGFDLNIFKREGCGACSKKLTHINGGTCKMLQCEETCGESSTGSDLANAADTVSKILGEKLTVKDEKTCCYEDFCNSAIRGSQGALSSSAVHIQWPCRDLNPGHLTCEASVYPLLHQRTLDVSEFSHLNSQHFGQHSASLTRMKSVVNRVSAYVD